VQKVYTATADSNGNATITINDVPSGMMWVVPQWSIETEDNHGSVVFRVGATCATRRNQRYITSTNLASGSTAFGPPAFVFNSGDTVTFTCAGLMAGDEAIATLFFVEKQWDANPDPNVVV
jgi:hypothetical protein